MIEHASLPSNGGTVVKPDPDLHSASPGNQFDDDIYEDAGDLDFTNSFQPIYLTRLPKYLWKTWSLLEDDQELHIGTIRVEGEIENPKRVCLIVST